MADDLGDLDRLPPELRLIIYHEVLLSDTDSTWTSFEVDHGITSCTMPAGRSVVHKRRSGLRGVSRALRAEYDAYAANNTPAGGALHVDLVFKTDGFNTVLPAHLVRYSPGPGVTYRTLYINAIVTAFNPDVDNWPMYETVGRVLSKLEQRGEQISDIVDDFTQLQSFSAAGDVQIRAVLSQGGGDFTLREKAAFSRGLSTSRGDWLLLNAPRIAATIPRQVSFPPR